MNEKIKVVEEYCTKLYINEDDQIDYTDNELLTNLLVQPVHKLSKKIIQYRQKQK